MKRQNSSAVSGLKKKMEGKKTDPKLPSYRVNFVNFWLFNIISQKNRLKFDSALASLAIFPKHLLELL